MTTAKVKEAILELDEAAQYYHDAETFESRLFWLKTIRAKANEIVTAVDETL